MKILLDTNIILDVVLRREPHFEHSFKIFNMVCNGDFDGCLSAKAITDINYFYTKSAPKEKVESDLGHLINDLEIVSIGKQELRKALALGFNDFEDAVVAVCAVKNKVDYIITRDKTGFEKSIVQALSPKDFLDKHFAEF